jgi:hypothetical protein
MYAWEVHAQRRVETFTNRQELDVTIEAVEAEKCEFLDCLNRMEGVAA